MSDILAFLDEPCTCGEGEREEMTCPYCNGAERAAKEIARLTAALDAANARNAELVTLLDQHLGHPCEQIRHAHEVESLRESLREMQALVVKGHAVVADFMPNIGRCVLQDYARLNTFMFEAVNVKAAIPPIAEVKT